MADELVARNYKAKSSCSTLTVENLSTTYKKVFFVQLIPHLKKFIWILLSAEFISVLWKRSINVA